MHLQIRRNGITSMLDASDLKQGIVASDGAVIQPDELAQAVAYDPGTGNLSSVTVTNTDGARYTQTYTYDVDGRITAVSAWIRQ